MFTASYPANIVKERDATGYHVSFPNLPEAQTSGNSVADALIEAADCLAEALAGRIAR
jgi:antitoxin HicB